MIDWFYSDPHFYHKNIIKYCRRPFKDKDHMNEQLIKRFNNRVGNNDTTLWVGDCFFTGIDNSKEILSQMNGKHLLVRGNHDGSTSRMERIGFSEVYDEYVIPEFFEELDLVAKHYPPEQVNVRFIRIHGHTHSAFSTERPFVYHVGVDAWGYAPAHRDELHCLIEQDLVEVLFEACRD